jgi:archaellum biogenesis protein FlaJ (TadC family)
MAWLPFLKEYSVIFLLGAIVVAVQAVLALYRRHQLLRDTDSEADLAYRKRRQLMRDSIIGFSLSFVLLVLYCLIQIISINLLPMLFSILLYIFGIALLSVFLVAVEKSKWRYQK